MAKKNNKLTKQQIYTKALLELKRAGVTEADIRNSKKSIQEVYESTFNKPINTINSTNSIINDKDGIQKSYNKLYGLDGNLGNIPNFAKSDLSGISTPKTNNSSNVIEDKDGILKSYNKLYGIDTNLGTVPKFNPVNLSGIPSASKSTPTIPTHSGEQLNVETPTMSGIDDTLDIQDSPTSKNKFNGSNVASLLRFAPAVGSLYNWLDKDKAAQIKLQRLPGQRSLNPGQVDTMGMQSILDSSYRKNVGDIVNASGGSGGASRAGILAAGLGSSKAKANAFGQLNLANIGNRMQADQFNIQGEARVGAGNTDVANRQKMINMQNQLAAEAQNVADRNAFFNSLGQIGVEQFQGNVIGAAQGYKTDLYGNSKFKG